MTPSPQALVDQPRTWFNKPVEDVVAEFTTNADSGLSAAEAGSRLASHGPNVIAAEPSPSVWAVALIQLKDSMNLMLIAVTGVSMLIQEWSTAMIVAFLVVLNVVMGTQQEMKARASVDALAKMTTPQAKVVRGGTLMQVSATDLVPGDIVTLESGDIVPADGRLIRSATLETQEAALTGESAPISKDPSTIDRDEVALGDRTNMVFQNTSVTRGTGAMVVTETGMGTQMGQIATMLSAVAPSKSPLQNELDSLTKVLGAIAWVAVAIIVALGLYRGQDLDQVLLLGVAMAISAIPTGLPTFVQAMLAYGAKELAAAKAIVKNLTDVETLGATSAINSDKTGTLTMNEMMVRSMYMRGHWYHVAGEGYAKTGRDPARRGRGDPGLHQPRLRPGPVQRRHRLRRRRGDRRPDRGGPGGAGREDRGGCPGEPADLPPGGRGPVRLRVQVHGHLPRGARSRRWNPAGGAGQGRPRRRAGPVHHHAHRRR